jgi:YNFM family putative membrane transporter
VIVPDGAADRPGGDGAAGGLGRVRAGSRSYRRTNRAFFAAGFVTFVALYDVQPLLPEFARVFSVSPAAGSLPLSVATAAMAAAMPFAGALSEAVGRKRLMTAALLSASVLTVLTAASHGLATLLSLRLLLGVALAGLPAVAMAYLAEELEPAAVGPAMGLYISGNAVGGMSGRILTAAVTDAASWRLALAAFGVLCLALSLHFAATLPPSHLPRRPFRVRHLAASLAHHLEDPILRRLYAVSFLVMGSFVTLYNYLAFRLLAPPYGLSRSHASLVFLVYLLGSASAAWAGRLVNRFDRRAMVRLFLAAMAAGALLTLARALPAVVAGVGLFTVGFFGAHSVASGWVGRRAVTARAQASALYLLFYYLGSSVSGTVGGLFWARGGWPAVTALILLLVAAAFLVTRRLSPLPAPVA